MAVAETSQLSTVIEQGGLTGDAAKWLAEQFQPFIKDADELIAKAEAINVTDATQVSEIKAAREIRIAIGKIRVAADKHRAAIKEDSLRRSQCIDAAGRWVKGYIEPVEARLYEMEKIAERAEAARKAALKASREALLAPFGTDTRFVNLSDMPEDTFTAMLNQAQAAHAAKIEAEKKAEADRIAAEAARRAEEERMRLENARLRQEAEALEAQAKIERERVEQERREAEAAARKEREAIEAKAKAEADAAAEVARVERLRLQALADVERQKREAAEAEARAAKEAAARKAAQEAEALKAAAAAPDKAKILALAETLRAVKVPDMATENGKAIGLQINHLLDGTIADIERLARKLGAKS